MVRSLVVPSCATNIACITRSDASLVRSARSVRLWSDRVRLGMGEKLLIIFAAKRLIFAGLSYYAAPKCWVHSTGVRWVEVCAANAGSVRYVLLALVAADKEPSEASDNSLDEIPWVESVHKSFDAQETAFVA